jgi:hypothetical protein
MSEQSALLIIRLIARGVGVAKSIQELAQRVERGETITEEEIEQAEKDADQAIKDWENS